MARMDTARLVLRPPEPHDFDAFFELHEDPEVLRHIPSSARGNRVAAWRTFAQVLGHWQIRGYGQWTVIEKASGEVIGRVGLWFPDGAPAIELGWIIRRSRWNNGFATEAAQAAGRYGLETVGARRLVSIIQPDNLASIRVAEKIGERLERTDVQNGATVLVYALS